MSLRTQTAHHVPYCLTIARRYPAARASASVQKTSSGRVRSQQGMPGTRPSDRATCSMQADRPAIRHHITDFGQGLRIGQWVAVDRN